jgi:hypothetical protein
MTRRIGRKDYHHSRLNVSPKPRKIDEMIDFAKHVIARDIPFQAEAIRRRFLHHYPFAHHREAPRSIDKIESEATPHGKRLFQHSRPKADSHSGDC